MGSRTGRRDERAAPNRGTYFLSLRWFSSATDPTASAREMIQLAQARARRQSRGPLRVVWMTLQAPVTAPRMLVFIRYLRMLLASVGFNASVSGALAAGGCTVNFVLSTFRVIPA
jgi:hypothetical protein